MTSRPTSPTEPTKKYPPPIQPNAHPYAIKTTSSALLSRNNSSPHSAHPTRHHYVPPPHSRIPTGTRVRHRHSSSLSSIEGEVCDTSGVRTIPTPLPTPPSAGKAETMLSSATKPLTENHSYDQKYLFGHEQDSRAELYAGLPADPKQWNTDELISYLETSFKLENTVNGGEGDSGLANILECVRTRGLTGRGLLRLTDADLTGTTLSDVQRTRLLTHSRILRADVLRGRIYVDSYRSHEVPDNSSVIYSESARCSASFRGGASMSADDLHLLLDNDTGKSESVLPPSPAMSLHRSNSVFDASTQRYRDLARLRMRRRGKVKGLVETWERASTSGSECSTGEEGSVSGSEAESESEVDRGFESISDSKHSPESPSNLPSAPHDEPHQDVRSSVVDPVLVPQEPPLSTPPPPYTHMHTTCVVAGEELSIEELLASSSNTPLRGARAWEADFGLGETVKRIPVPLNADAGNPSPPVAEPDASCHPQDGGQQTKGDSVRSRGSGTRRSTGSGRKSVNARRRVVTAIFTGSPADNVSDDADDEMHSGARRPHAIDVASVVRDETPTSLDSQNDPDRAIRQLEASIEATRAQVEAFKLRLEEVEADAARQQMILMRAQIFDALRSSDFESGQRRSEASERAKHEARAALEDTPLTDIARAIIAKAMRWLFSYEHLGVQVEESRTRADVRPGANDRYRTPAKRDGRLPLVRMSCNIILVSFAICAVILRRMGFGRWARRP